MPLLEATVLFGALTLLTVAVFARLAEHRLFTLVLSYVVFPFLTWAALRFEGRGAATAATILAVSSSRSGSEQIWTMTRTGLNLRQVTRVGNNTMPARSR